MLVAMVAAKGSPGVTTTARVLASVWDGPVILADCDPAGGDLSILARAQGGTVLDPERGLLSLATQARRGPGESLADHVQRVEGGLDVLCGVASPEQAAGMGPAWAAVATALRSAPGTDVIADCGRLTAGSPSLPVVATADAVVFVVRPGLEGYAHLRERLRWLTASAVNGSRGSQPTGVVVVTQPSDDRSPRELAQLLAHSSLAVPVIGRIALDQRAADVIAGRVERGIGRSLLVRSARETVSQIRWLAGSAVPQPVG